MCGALGEKIVTYYGIPGCSKMTEIHVRNGPLAARVVVTCSVLLLQLPLQGNVSGIVWQPHWNNCVFLGISLN